LRSESPSGMCAKLCTVAASNNRDHPCTAITVIACSRHICGVVLRAHPVHGESHIQRNGEVATNPLIFITNRTDRTFFLWRLNPARPSHPGHSTILLCLESPSSNCAELRTVAASNNRDHAPQSLYYCLFVPHMWCCSSSTSNWWLITHSTQRQPRG